MSAPRTIPADFRLLGASVEITAGEGKKPRLAMVVNSGRPFSGWGYNAILDLSGLETAADQVMPILRQHDAKAIVGQSDRIEKTAAGVVVAGDVYPDFAAGAEVLAGSAKTPPFRWQASFGLRADATVEWVGRGEQVTVNGHAFTDGLVIRKAMLREASFVPLGADAQTSAIALVAADGAGPQIPLPPRRSSPMSEPKPATVAELRAAFPDAEDKDFVLEQLEAGATLDAANVAYSKVVVERNKKLKADLAAAAKAQPAQPPAPAKAPRPPVATAAMGAPAPAPTSARDEFTALVEKGVAAGMDRAAARLSAAGADMRLDAIERDRRKALHARYVTEANPDAGKDWTPLERIR